MSLINYFFAKFPFGNKKKEIHINYSNKNNDENILLK